jgi:hypothetical protein
MWAASRAFGSLGCPGTGLSPILTRVLPLPPAKSVHDEGDRWDG